MQGARDKGFFFTTLLQGRGRHMALASQTVRKQEVTRGPKNNFQSPRRKRKQTVAIGIAAAVVILGGGYVAYTQWGGSGKAEDKSIASNAGEKKPSTPVTTPGETGSSRAPENRNVPVPVTPKPEVKPDVLTMGSPQPGTSGTPATTPTSTNLPTNTPATSGAGTGGVVDPLGRGGVAPAVTPTGPAAVPASTPAPAVAPASADDMPTDAAGAVDRAKRAMGENKLVEARGLLNTVLANPRVKESEKDAIRTWVGEINQTLIFSPTVAAGDPLAETYKVASGDVLERIARSRGLAVDWRLLARVNRMSNPNALRLGQNLKLVRGPFHAVVHKGSFRVDIYAGLPLPPGSTGTPRADGSEEGWTFIKSFPVGLGEHNGTPLGTFVVKRNSKLVNPHWVNPRTGEKFDANDPKNPIGEHWLGLTGIDEKTKSIAGYGMHGTIQPESIGKEMSMGCVRMRTEDIAVVWELLADEVSTVRIVQ